MTAERFPEFCLALLVGAILGGFFALTVLRRASARFMRTNVDGIKVPAVLGWAVGGTGIFWAVVGPVEGGSVRRVGWAVALVAAAMFFAGLMDDARGDEADRGFKGHVRALARGRLTGGVLKMVVGAVAGGAAGLLLGQGPRALEIALLVPLSANLLNLFDRAPGRAGKVALLAAIPLVALGHPLWAFAAAGLLGALVSCLPLDLRARGMLGDAGANAVGAVLGLGLALSVGQFGRIVALVVLVAATAASEVVSFSKLIERTPVLRELDHAGRRKRVRSGRSP